MMTFNRLRQVLDIIETNHFDIVDVKQDNYNIVVRCHDARTFKRLIRHVIKKFGSCLSDVFSYTIVISLIDEIKHVRSDQP